MSNASSWRNCCRRSDSPASVSSVLEQAIRDAVADWSLGPIITVLMAMRGLDFVAAVGNLSRFASARQLVAYLGLVPSERSTGESVKRCSITKAGNGRTRRVLVEGGMGLPSSSAGRVREAGPGRRCTARGRQQEGESLSGGAGRRFRCDRA